MKSRCFIFLLLLISSSVLSQNIKNDDVLFSSNKVVKIYPKNQELTKIYFNLNKKSKENYSIECNFSSKGKNGIFEIKLTNESQFYGYQSSMQFRIENNIPFIKFKDKSSGDFVREVKGKQIQLIEEGINKIRIQKTGFSIKFFINNKLAVEAPFLLSKRNDIDGYINFSYFNVVSIITNMQKTKIEHLKGVNHNLAFSLIAAKYNGSKGKNIINNLEEGTITFILKNTGNSTINKLPFILGASFIGETNLFTDLKILTTIDKVAIDDWKIGEIRNIQFRVKNNINLNIDNFNFNLVTYLEETYPEEKITIKANSLFSNTNFQIPSVSEKIQSIIGNYYGYNSIDYSLCKNELEKLHNQNEKKATIWKGLLTLKGISNFTKNEDDGEFLIKSNLDYLFLQVSKGDVDAMYLLAEYYINSSNSSEFKQGIGNELLKKAAELNYIPAIFDYATLLRSKNENSKSYLLLDELNKKGIKKAAYHIGRFYLEKGDNIEYLEDAIKWFNKSKDYKDLDAFITLSYIYKVGLGETKIDIPLAENLLLEAASLGSIDAKYYLANFYLDLYYDSKFQENKVTNIKKATDFFREVSIHEHRDGMFKLGLIYSNKEIMGDSLSYTEGYEWIKKSAIAGNTTAMISLSSYYKQKNIDNMVKYRYWANEAQRRGIGNGSEIIQTRSIFEILNDSEARTEYKYAPTLKHIYTYDNYGLIKYEVVGDETDYLSPLTTAFFNATQLNRSEYLKKKVNNVEFIKNIGNKKIYAGSITSEIKNGLTINPNQIVNIKVEGSIQYEVNFYGTAIIYTANGIDNHKLNNESNNNRKIPEYAEYKLGTLLYKIGHNDIQILGEEAIDLKGNQGELYLVINDGETEKNKGYFDIIIEVTE